MNEPRGKIQTYEPEARWPSEAGLEHERRED
jgi:hypothetical protein